jgi:hypothetical protein
MSSSSQLCNSFGLICNIVGVVLVWIFGWPQPSHEESIGLGLEDSTPLKNGLTVREWKARIGERRATYRIQSIVGLLLMIAGFGFQFVAVWL